MIIFFVKKGLGNNDSALTLHYHHFETDSIFRAEERKNTIFFPGEPLLMRHFLANRGSSKYTISTVNIMRAFRRMVRYQEEYCCDHTQSFDLEK